MYRVNKCQCKTLVDALLSNRSDTLDLWGGGGGWVVDKIMSKISMISSNQLMVV